MKLLCLAWLGSLLASQGVWAQPLASPAPPDGQGQLLVEQRHFIGCLITVYDPALWISYNDGLYFLPKTDGQVQQIEACKTARSYYVALTNRLARHDLLAGVLADSGIAASWQKKLLLPYSETEPSLTPTLGREIRILPRYKVVQSLGGGDVLLQADSEARCFVMRFGRGTSDGSGTNAWLIKEGVKSFRTPDGEYAHAEAFTSVSLSKEETAALDQVVAALRKKAAALNQELARAKGTDGAQEFQDLKARASDSNPYMQYLLARAYLEGKGTDKDEKLGLTWMKRAAQNGSGDATAYLNRFQSGPPPPR